MDRSNSLSPMDWPSDHQRGQLPMREEVQPWRFRATLTDPLQEPEAAAAIVNANKAVVSKPTSDDSKTGPVGTPNTNAHLRPGTSPLQRAWSFDPGAQGKFDKYGRRIFSNASNPHSPRGSAQNSIPGTPRRGDFEVRPHRDGRNGQMY